MTDFAEASVHVNIISMTSWL